MKSYSRIWMTLVSPIAEMKQIWGAKSGKGAHIPQDCIVAAKSVVCAMKEKVKEGSLLGGTPARVLKENINWNIQRIKL